MIHDIELTDRLQQLPTISFDGPVYRATGLNSDPSIFSSRGGRWAPPDGSDGSFSILYTSSEQHGALAELASYLSLLNPVPRKPLRVHQLEVATENSLKIVVGDFVDLGIEPQRYMERNYLQTQLVGAAINFLGFDGFLAPSARWGCDNLMLCDGNYPQDSKLDVITYEDFGYDVWSELSTVNALFAREEPR